MSAIRLTIAGLLFLLAADGSIEQRSQGAKPALALLNSFDGLGAGLEPGPGTNHPPPPRNPSDNSLAVGPNHVFQIVNAQLAIFTKSGTLLHGPVSTNTIFAGAGGVCEARPNGDAVVRYDQLAGRWLVVMPIFRRTVFDADRSKHGEPARPGDAARANVGRPGPPPPLPPPVVGADRRVRPGADTQVGIAIGYTFGGSPNYPGQRFAARLANDPPGVLTFRESVLVEGEASQNAMRWEDYTQTAMDPSDDCTIWYAGDYVKKDAATYSTRIGSFRMPGC